MAKTLGIFQVSTSDQRVKTWTGRYLSYFAAEYLLVRKARLAAYLPAPTYSEGARVSRRVDASVHDLIRLDPAAIGLLAEHDPCLAAECLPEIPVRQRGDSVALVVAQLITLLSERHRDEDAKKAAAQAIAAIGPGAVSPLGFAMEHCDHWLRRRLVGVLRRIEGDASVDLIVRTLRDPNNWVVKEAESAILAFDVDRRRRVSAFIDGFRNTEPSSHDHELLRQLGTLSEDFAPSVSAVLRIEIEVIPGVAASEAGRTTTDESGDESFEGTGAGFDLVEQLIATPNDAATIRRCRVWLRRASMYDKTWASVWIALWDHVGSDHELQKLGGLWLDVVPGIAGAWPHVWDRLVGGCLDDSSLIRKGHWWLQTVDQGHRGWPFVWSMLSRAMPEDRDLQDEGFLWLKEKAWIDQNWERVWSPLRSVPRLNQEPDQIARELLQITPPANASWGHAWPALFRADTTDATLYELGRAWLSNAPPAHSAWGYIWPLIWNARPNDSEVEVIGREWLDRASSIHGGWNLIWELLWAAYPNDRALLDEAIAWLRQAPADHGGWARIWQLVWAASGGSPTLETLGRHWLESGGASPHHAGWPFMFGSLIQNAPGDVRLAERGLAWLRGIEPSNKGWANVWRELWDCKRRAEDSEQTRELSALGKQWLESNGVAHNGFSLVWEQLWNHLADDQLRRLALDRLWQHSNDSTWMYIWLPLSRTLLNDSSLTKQGIALLRDGIPRVHPQWSAVWADLFRRDSGSAEIRRLGTDWLADMAGSAIGWERVWKQFWDDSPAAQSLVAVGVIGLKLPLGIGPWKTVWRSMFAVLGTNNSDLVSTAIWWLRSPGSHRVEDVWLEVAQDLQNGGQLPSDLAPALRFRKSDIKCGPERYEVCRKVAESYSYTRKWKEQWEAMWSPSCESLLVDSGLRWLNDALAANVIPANVPYIWNKIYISGLERPRLIELGRRWLRARDSGTRGWGLVWRGVMRDIPFELDLAREGVRWIDNSYSRTTWPEVWATLWDLGLTDPAHLTDAAISWLSLPDPTRRGYADVWCRLWDSSVHRVRLQPLGHAFAELTSSHEGWIEVVVRMGMEGLFVGELRDRVAEWYARNSDDPRAGSTAIAFSLVEAPDNENNGGGGSHD